jgi:multidrug resistance efflux pump
MASGCDPEAPEPESTATVRRTDFSVSVIETCEFRPLRSHAVLARASDKIDWIVPEGASVKTGDLIFSQDRTSLEERLANHDSELEAAERNLEEVLQQVEVEREESCLQVEALRAAVTLANTRLDSVTAAADKVLLVEAEAAFKAAAGESQSLSAAAGYAREMHRQGFLSATELKNEELAAELAAVAMERSRLRFENLKSGASPPARRIAALELQQARLELERARANAAVAEAGLTARVGNARARMAYLQRAVSRDRRWIKNRELRSPAAGVVIYRNLHWRRKIKPEVGSRVWAGAAVVNIADLAHMKIRTQLAERHIRHLKVGATLQVRADPLPGLNMKARVTWIDRWSRDRSADLAKADREKEGLSGVKVFAVEAAVLGSDPRIKPGFKGKAEFTLSSFKNVLVVPSAAVFGPVGEQFVLLPGAQGSRRVPVRVLANGGQQAAVDAELEPGQVIITRGSE